MIKTIRQDGTYLKWPDFWALNVSNETLSNFMLKDAKLWLNDGFTFGQGGDGFERLNIAAPPRHDPAGVGADREGHVGDTTITLRVRRV